MRRIELLASARDLATAIAAIDCGADAVYIGASEFGARSEAANSVEDIARAVDYAHVFGVKVYATLNTLLFDSELESAERLARRLVEAGVDALIIQDMAYMRMGIEGIDFHASTQMCNTSPEQVKFLEECGFTRVILERGLSLEEIRKIRRDTEIGLEVFVHGAICVSHSGVCYLGRTMSERSGNRGTCSQPCRLTYDLTEDSGRVIIKGKHLLSLHDLNLSGQIGNLLDAGIDSFKIEGRLKDRIYVKNIVSHYRRILDEAIASRKDCARSSTGESVVCFDPNPEKSFYRGFTEYFIDGRRFGVASFDTPKSLGEPLGKVKKRGDVWFEISSPLASGDGICLFAEGQLIGTNVNRVDGRRIFPASMEGLSEGVEIFRNSDREFIRQAERDCRREIGCEASLTLSEERIVLKITDCEGVEVSAEAEGPFERAENEEQALNNIRNHIMKSGGTASRMDRAYISHGDFIPFVALSKINALRRTTLELLAEKRKKPARRYPKREEKPVKYPFEPLNITNSLAERFYRDHGVEYATPGIDLGGDFHGRCVMTSPYCIRRETGECLKENSERGGNLYLLRGTKRYRLEFDCNNCLMRIIYE